MKSAHFSRNIFITIFTLIVAILLITTLLPCKLSDDEAIKISKKLCAKLKYDDTRTFKIVSKNIIREFMLGIKYKAVSVYHGDNEMSMFVGCDNKDVVGIYNDSLYSEYIQRNTSEVNGKKVLKWKPFISDDKATNIILSIGKEIGLPEDVKLSSVVLDKYKGIWTGRWKRMLNNIEFEDDYIIISIMAVDGDLYAFTKYITGEPCSTNAIISREEAIKAANNEFKDNFTEEEWKNNQEKFEVKSCDLKIVQKKPIFKRILFMRRKSQLAWVVTISTKDVVGGKTIGIINKDASTIRVDANTGKVLSTDINIAH